MQGLLVSSNPRAREVRRLTLRVADEDAAQRARIALEDGLATADFGDVGRLIFVRRLTLRPLGSDFNGPTAARAIEVSFRALLPAAIHAADPRASEAPIVWFADRVEALLEALTEIVESRPLAAWYWRPALASLLPAGAAPEIATLVAAIAAPPQPHSSAPRAALAALARRWAEWSDGAFARLVVALPEDMNGESPAPEPRAVTHIYRDRDVDRRAAARVEVAARVHTAKARWVARAELAAIGALPAAAARERAYVDATVAACLCGDGEVPRDVAARREAAAAPAPAERHAQPRADEERPAAASGAADRSAPLAELRDGLPPWLADARPSTRAGFCMLLNAWHAVGFDAWLDEQEPELREPLVQLWLEAWARRLGVAADDAQRLAWEPPPADLPRGARAALAPWASTTRCWLRTRARIGPASLAMRAGEISITRTHLDVLFPLGAIDVRVRRAGLDTDPGWVPWFGRIVAFHFVEREGAHAG